MEISINPDSGEIVYKKGFEPHLGKNLLKCLKAYENRVHQIDIISNTSETYGSVRSRSIRVAQTLLEKGFETNDVIMICAENHNDSIIPLFASMYIGLMPVCLTVGMKFDEVSHLVSLAKPKMIFTDPEMLSVFENVLKSLNFDTRIVVFGRIGENHDIFDDYCLSRGTEMIFSCKEFNPDTTPALGLCSSGSTGFPKIVMITHKALILQFLLPLIYMKDTFIQINKNPKVGDGVFNFAPLIWISGIYCVFITCLYGIVKYHCAKVFDAEVFKQAMTFKPSKTVIVGSAFHELMQYRYLKEVDMSCIGYIGIAGCPVRKENIEAFQKMLPNGVISVSFGATETGSISNGMNYERGSIGKIGKWFQWKVVDMETEKNVGSGEIGELRLKSETLFKGYYGDQKSTEDSFDNENFYKTGDLVYHDDDGYFYYVDRCREVIKFGHVLVSSIELEDRIDRIREVLKSGVVNSSNTATGEIVVLAFVELIPDRTLSEKSIKDVIRDALPYEENVDVGVIIIKKIPVTHNGKINRRILNLMKLTAKWE